MKTVVLTFVNLAAIGVLCSGQKSPVLPSDKEIETLLNDPKEVSKTVDCVILFVPGKCDPRLKEAYELAPEYFASSGNCRSCSDDTLRRVRKFLVRLQKKYRREYMRLLNSVSK